MGSRGFTDDLENSHVEYKELVYGSIWDCLSYEHRRKERKSNSPDVPTSQDFPHPDLSHLMFSPSPLQSGRTLPTISEDSLPRPPGILVSSSPPPKLPLKPARLRNRTRQAQCTNVPSIHHISLSKDITEWKETNERKSVFGPFSDFSSSSSCSSDSSVFGKKKERISLVSPFKTVNARYDDEFSGAFSMTFKEIMEWKKCFLQEELEDNDKDKKMNLTMKILGKYQPLASVFPQDWAEL